MRIIGGKLKGKNISFEKSKITRPLRDSVKENIFNILSHSNLLKINLDGANVLDVYSGIGSFGLECISRGANKVTFIENNSKAVKILKKNIFNLSISDKAKVIPISVFNFFNKKIDTKFDIIFLDPPFIDKSFQEILNIIYDKKIFNKNHIFIIHRENIMEEKINNFLKPILIKKYGRSKIFFFKF